MKILVTGAGGFIAGYLIEELLRADYEVVGLDSDLYEQCTFGSAPQEFPSIRKDVRDVAIGDLKGFDAVLHLAAPSSPRHEGNVG